MLKIRSGNVRGLHLVLLISLLSFVSLNWDKWEWYYVPYLGLGAFYLFGVLVSDL